MFYRRWLFWSAFCFSLFCDYSMQVKADFEPTSLKYDCVVYGGTSSGVIAAVKVARLGMSVILIEPSKHIGGLTSSGLGATDTGNTGAIGGIAKEFYKRIFDFYQGDNLADTNYQCQWNFEPHVAEMVFKNMLREAHVETRLNERLALKSDVTLDNKRILAIRMESGLIISGKIFIDATYEGDLMAKSGVSYAIGRESNSKYNESLNGIQTKNAKYHQFTECIDPYNQPGKPKTGLIFGIDANHPGQDGQADRRIQAYCYRLCLTDNTENMVPFQRPAKYDRSKYELLLRYINSNRTVTPFFTTAPMPHFKTDSNNKGPFSFDYIGMNYAYPDGDYNIRARIEADHENYQRGFLYFLSNDPCVPLEYRKAVSKWGLAKDEFADNNNWPYKIYVREARRMISDYVMTEHNCAGKTIAPDSIGLGAYAMDSHHVQRYIDANGCVRNEGDVEVGSRKPNIYSPYPISYRAIVPKSTQCNNLLVPVCVSASHIAFGSIRMEPVFMVLGESAATAAGEAIKKEIAVQDVNYSDLRLKLLNDGQILDWNKVGFKNKIKSGEKVSSANAPLQGQPVVCTLKTEYQNGLNDIFVLLPDKRQPGRTFPVLYVLPVFPGSQAALAGLDEVRRLDLHNRYNIICVAPAYEIVPWYADNPANKNIRQESYFLNSVIPLIDEKFPTKKNPAERFLLGFSKSGWGAWSLLLRHPELFGRAVSWDAPLMMQKIKDYNTPDIMGIQENFEQYCITILLKQQAAMLRNQPAKLILLGHGHFEQDDISIHELMNSLGIPHYWDHGPKREHSWNSGWLEPAVEILMQNNIEQKCESQGTLLRKDEIQK